MPAASRPPAVRLADIYKAFITRGSGDTPLLALEDVSFSAEQGEFLSLVGPSGCGKSTCLNLLAGLDEPSSGSVEHHGRPVRGVNTQLGYITQDDNLLPWRTLLANVELGLEFKGVSKTEQQQRAQEFIDLVGLTGFEKHYPHELSGGMRYYLRQAGLDPDQDAEIIATAADRHCWRRSSPTRSTSSTCRRRRRISRRPRVSARC